MKRNVVAWAALIVSSAALVSSSGLLRTAPAAPQFVGESQKTARALSDAIVGVAEFVKPSVVQISAEKKAGPRGMGGGAPNGNPHQQLDPKDMEEMLKRFFGPNGPKFEKEQFGLGQATGSGFVYDDHGHILTNNHVVEGATRVVVQFADGEEHNAKIIGTDPKTDVAVIKIESKDFRALPKGISSKVKVGELVLAVGSPFGFDQSVTTGIVSALGRSSAGILDTPQAYEDFIQTDAAINPGNSGGPLVDMDGRVIGINSAIATSSRSSSGVGFAIPIDMASNIADRLIKDGKVKRAAIGIALQPLDPAKAKELTKNSKTKGVLVGKVFEGSPADKAGLQTDDIITKFDDFPALNVASFRSHVALSDSEKPHTVSFIRKGEAMTAEISLGSAETVLAKAEAENTRLFQRRNGGGGDPAEPKTSKLNDFGIEVQELTPVLAQLLGHKADTKGLLVRSITPNSPAAAAGLKAGEIITQVIKDKKPQSVETIQQFQELVGKSDELAFYIKGSGDEGKFVPLVKKKK
jgi:serine protease Do